jgi:hypothetical protein
MKYVSSGYNASLIFSFGNYCWKWLCGGFGRNDILFLNLRGRFLT